ncbi:PilC/PilY family type IV pilus protein [Pseudomonas oryzihabitans]|uniref:PilC/PilY family type IV pilus protein n=1 Tax=Pseudomonas oryzihabitans TaxID=47885 RepID=UPI0021D91E71|nr:PilC/PilY family type IV pilus protein [Pseudomonas oryzihabitans]
MKIYLARSLITVGALVSPLLSSAADDINVAQSPLFVTDSVPPLNLLVMGRDHKLFYEAYNDASDLNGDGILDIGYKGYKTKADKGIDYYGYFNSKLCYTYTSNRFVPTGVGSGTTGKECTSQWSGDFLNYIATSRMDALRKVLFGGYRSTDDATTTVLQGAHIPQDAHTWGKEYTSVSVDGYDISKFTPLKAPTAGYRHLIAVASLTETGVPQMRVLTNVNLRIWNWVSIERPVGGDECVNASGARIICTNAGPKNGWTLIPPETFTNLKISTWAKSNNTHPTNAAGMTTLFNTDGQSSRLCGSKAISNGIYAPGSNNNPFNGAVTSGKQICGNDYYITEITGTIKVDTTGTYKVSVDGDDAVEVKLGGTTVGWYGGHGPLDSGSDAHSGSVSLQAGVSYDIVFRHEEVDGGDSWGLYWQTPAGIPENAKRVDYNVQVEVCPNDVGNTSNSALRESNCRLYLRGNYKPTGILHDYGETDKMYFGLLTGSYKNHFYGGVLRSNIQSFARELTLSTGQFCLNGNCGAGNDVSGIVDTINKFRTVGFTYYNSNGTNNFQYDQDGCGYNRNPTSNLATDPCYMWGTPTAEMMYEALRYFAGASGPTPSFAYSKTTTTPDSRLGLSQPDWLPPYSKGNGGSGYPRCAVPAMTVLSDINPNYDWKLPGSRWDNTTDGSGNPKSISDLNVGTETDAIGAAEGLNDTKVFIGETESAADSAPTQKTLTALSRVRGLAPEEPGKQGTYYSAGIARFGAMHNIGGSKPLLTYAVALASPFPKIEFPVGDNKITLVPFAKSVQNPGQNQYQATNQIADFYVQKLANTTTANTDSTVNGGRPYAEFRINWEDSEEGADFDMDAIVLYTLAVAPDPSDGGKLKLNITLTSEYAAGGAQQHMGYTISGTDKDGLYLEVCDLRDGTVNNGQRSVCDSQTAYRLNTPPNRPAGWCIANLDNPECKGLPPTAVRQFSATGVGAGVLKDPLWYAAKYGTTGNWDTDGDQVPDNYLLVTNALTLKDQLAKAFNSIVQKNSSVTRVTVQGGQTDDTGLGNRIVYRTSFNADGWTGDLIKDTYKSDGKTINSTIRANFPDGRVVKMVSADGKSLQDFSYENLKDRSFDGTNLRDSLDSAPSGNRDGQGVDRVRFLLGQCTSSGCPNFRTRTSLLGDIVNSSPVLVGPAQYLAYRIGKVDGTVASYTAFQKTQASRRAQIYVGANDGMLHAFDAATLKETFAFVPTPVIPNLNRLMAKDYGTANLAHHYYVDGPITVRDVYFKGDNTWRTVLVGTLGGGGRGLFALDITDPDPVKIKLLWEFTSDSAATLDAATKLSNLGYSFGKPSIERLHDGNWAAIFGNGYYSANANSGKAILYALKIEDGTLIKALEAKSPTGGSNGLSTIQAADYNADIVTDAAYAGDLLGNLWRFDLFKPTSADTPFARDNDGADSARSFQVAFGGAPLYRATTNDQTTGSGAGKPQAITVAPVLIQHPTLTGYLVAFGTGRYLGVNDKVSPFDVQTVYGVWDRWTLGQTTTDNMVKTRNRSSLQQQTLTAATYSNNGVTRNVRLLSANSINWYTGSGETDADVDRSGWYVDLKLVGSTTNTGERIVFPLRTLGDALVFTSITPNADPCSAGLDSILYATDAKAGGRTLHNVFDLNNDGRIDGADSLSSGSISGTDGTIGDNSLTGTRTGNTNLTTLICDSSGNCISATTGPAANGRQSWRMLLPAQ